MCELHFYKCACGQRWMAHRKLASCESADPAARCQESLCMYVGNARRPRKRECEGCRVIREMLESVEGDSDGGGDGCRGR